MESSPTSNKLCLAPKLSQLETQGSAEDWQDKRSKTSQVFEKIGRKCKHRLILDLRFYSILISHL